MNSVPNDDEVLGPRPDGAGPAAVWDVKNEIWQDTKTEYTSKSENGFFRHTFIRGPAQNDTEVARDSSQCLMSFKNLDTNDEGNISIIGKGQLPVEKSFLDIVGPLLCTGSNAECLDPDSTSFNTDDEVINERGDNPRDFQEKEKFIRAEFNFLKRFAYEYFIVNVGAAAYRNDGSSIATDVSNVDSQGTAYKIYSCGILYGPGGRGEYHNGEVEILIPLESIVVMPT